MQMQMTKRVKGRRVLVVSLQTGSYGVLAFDFKPHLKHGGNGPTVDGPAKRILSALA